MSVPKAQDNPRLPREKGKFGGRPKNSDVRPREYLTEKEVNQLIKAARNVGRHQHRDGTLILIMFRHGLRVSEAINLRWSQLDLDRGSLHVNRSKRGMSSIHPLAGLEIRALRRLKRGQVPSPFVFTTERLGPLTVSNVQKMVFRAGQRAGIPFRVHPHMLRHACGFKLANEGVDTRALQHYLGHTNIQHTVRYTDLVPDRFNGFWQD